MISMRPSDARGRHALPDPLTNGQAGHQIEGGQRHEEAISDRQRAEFAADGSSADHGQAAEPKSRDGQ